MSVYRVDVYERVPLNAAYTDRLSASRQWHSERGMSVYGNLAAEEGIGNDAYRPHITLSPAQT